MAGRVRRTIWALAVFLLASPSAQFAQDQPELIAFDYRFGGPGNDVGNAIIELAGGGYAAVGYTDAGDARGIDVLLVRLDVNGQVVWRQTYGDEGDDYGWDLFERDDGGFFIVGYTNSTPGGDEDVVLIRVDETGAFRWRRRFGAEQAERAWSLEPTPDGGMAIAAQTQSAGAGDWDTYLLRLTAGGDPMWSLVTGEAGPERILDAALAEDGGFLFVGTTATGPDAPRDLYFIRLDSLGKSLWERAYGGPGDDVAHGVVSAGDGGFLVTGYGNSFGAGSNDVYLLCLADDSVIEWRNEIGGPGDDRAMMSIRRAGGGFMTIGYTDAGRAWDVLLLETDESGERVSERTLAFPGPDRGVMIRPATDGGYILTGAFASPAGGTDFGVIKLRR